MSRRRLLWFTFGFASAYAVLSQTVLKDLMVQRLALSSRMERDFSILEARLYNIEQSSLPNPSSSSSSSSLPAPDQVEG